MSSGATLYRIRNYSETFLTDKTRGRDGRLRFLQLPVRPDDVDYISIASGPDGALALGVWLALLELAGTLPVRDGALRRSNGNPLTLKEISVLTRLSFASTKRGMTILAEHDWILTDTTIPNDSERCPSTPPREEGSLEEGSLDISSAPPPRPPGDGHAWFLDFWNANLAKALPAIQAFGPERARALSGLLKAASGDRDLVCRAAAAFASWEFAIEKRLGVDTFLRASNRSKYLEWGESGPPGDNGSVGHVTTQAVTNFLRGV